MHQHRVRKLVENMNNMASTIKAHAVFVETSNTKTCPRMAYTTVCPARISSETANAPAKLNKKMSSSENYQPPTNRLVPGCKAKGKLTGGSLDMIFHQATVRGEAINIHEVARTMGMSRTAIRKRRRQWLTNREGFLHPTLPRPSPNDVARIARRVAVVKKMAHRLRRRQGAVYDVARLQAVMAKKGHAVSRRTMHRTLAAAGFGAKITQPGPDLDEAHVAKRLAFGRRWQRTDPDIWLFSDEAYVTGVDSRGGTFLQRRPGPSANAVVGLPQEAMVRRGRGPSRDACWTAVDHFPHAEAVG
jgi:hypothetical protein